MIIYQLAVFTCIIPICIYRYPLSDPRVNFLGWLNIITLGYTLILLLMKIVLIDYREMKQDLYTFVDLGIVLLSYCEIFIGLAFRKSVFIPSAFSSLFILKTVIWVKTMRSSSSIRDYY
jgi:hypothetical protein